MTSHKSCRQTLHLKSINLHAVIVNYEDEEIDMYLDLHAHTGLLGAFVYGNSYTDVYRFQRHTLFPKHLSYCAPDFSLEHTAYNKDKNKQGTSRR
ncbi:uncharacterized protein TNIN_47721 [Trichonephila inaurata madagascariensis]|uniref:Peptidase M14 carboxypeptidase A domain-containing protein n=1 Tax=Trichonephila inaurata madagascariensis TaxID=2747483 RepID=A0A8X6YFH5_9ARAC|nr:uncharacterized protein TNIN_47721 [Trichonephila inaurata madagascariensis]